MLLFTFYFDKKFIILLSHGILISSIIFLVLVYFNYNILNILLESYNFVCLTATIAARGVRSCYSIRRIYCLSIQQRDALSTLRTTRRYKNKGLTILNKCGIVLPARLTCSPYLHFASPQDYNKS